MSGEQADDKAASVAEGFDPEDGSNPFRRAMEPWRRVQTAGEMSLLRSLDLDTVRNILMRLRIEKNHLTSDSPPLPWSNDLGVSGHWCGKGAELLFKEISGVTIKGNGNDWDEKMRGKIAAGVIPYKVSTDENDKQYAPENSVLVWHYPPNGHVAIVTAGKWVSDFMTDSGHQLQGGQLPDFVFVPENNIQRYK